MVYPSYLHAYHAYGLSHDFCNLAASMQCHVNSISLPLLGPRETPEGNEETQAKYGSS